MRYPILRTATVLALAAAATALAAELHPMRTEGAQALGMSSDGSSVVATVTPTFLTPPSAMVWKPEFDEEHALPGLSGGEGINAAGVVAGRVPIDGGSGFGGRDQAALVSFGDDAPTLLLPDFANHDSSVAKGIADTGITVGVHSSEDFTVYEAVAWDAPSAMTPLPLGPTAGSLSGANAINGSDGTVIAGFVDTGDAFHSRRGVVWVDRSPVFVANGEGHPVGEAFGISYHGRYVVGANYDIVDPAASGAWLWDSERGVVTRLPSMDHAYAVSDSGDVVIGNLGGETRVSMVWIAGRGTLTLRDYLEHNHVARPPGWAKPVGALTLIDRSGTIIGGCCLPATTLPFGNSFVLTGLEHDFPDALFAAGFEDAFDTNLVADPGFESGASGRGGSRDWQSFDGNPEAQTGATLFVDESQVRGTAANHGLGLALFGGYGNGGAETQWVRQAIVIPRRTLLRLRYAYFLAYDADAQARFAVRVDDEEVDHIDMLTEVPTDDYAVRVIDVSRFADGGPHVLEFRYDYAGGEALDGWLMLDDVSIASPAPVIRDTKP